MIRIAIVDDEPNILDRIKQSVLSQFKKRNIAITIVTYTNGSDLLNAVETGYLFDVVFLDIELPDGFGLNVAKQLRNSYRNIIIAFVTSFDNYVYDAFAYDVIGYIRKHVLDSRLGTVIDRVIKKFREISNERSLKTLQDSAESLLKILFTLNLTITILQFSSIMVKSFLIRTL